MQAFHYNYGGTNTMRNARIPADEQYSLVMECRSSGLSDAQWCIEHDIKPGTFYNWVKRLRKKACYDIPAATRGSGITAPVKQDVVKVDVVPDSVRPLTDLPAAKDVAPDFEPAVSTPIEIHFHKAVLRVTNDVDPRLLMQILRVLEGSAC